MKLEIAILAFMLLPACGAFKKKEKTDKDDAIEGTPKSYLTEDLVAEIAGTNHRCRRADQTASIMTYNAFGTNLSKIMCKWSDQNNSLVEVHSRSNDGASYTEYKYLEMTYTVEGLPKSYSQWTNSTKSGDVSTVEISYDASNQLMGVTAIHGPTTRTKSFDDQGREIKYVVEYKTDSVTEVRTITCAFEEGNNYSCEDILDDNISSKYSRTDNKFSSQHLIDGQMVETSNIEYFSGEPSLAQSTKSSATNMTSAGILSISATLEQTCTIDEKDLSCSYFVKNSEGKITSDYSEVSHISDEQIKDKYGLNKKKTVLKSFNFTSKRYSQTREYTMEASLNDDDQPIKQSYTLNITAATNDVSEPGPSIFAPPEGDPIAALGNYAETATITVETIYTYDSFSRVTEKAMNALTGVDASELSMDKEVRTVVTYDEPLSLSSRL